MGSVHISLCTSVPGHPVAPLLAELFLRRAGIGRGGSWGKDSSLPRNILPDVSSPKQVASSEQLSCQSENPVCTLIALQGRLIFSNVTAARNPDVSLLRESPSEFYF